MPPNEFTYIFKPLFILNIQDFNSWISVLIILILILLSAFLSGSEVAIFGLSNSQKKKLKEENNKNSERILKLLSEPKKLLATILIGNNLVNVAIVIISSLILKDVFSNYSFSPILNFVIQVILVTFLILLFGEVIPKVYANNYN
ncbi:MAG: magnesium/cobalt efflux protein, partial [Crocinitomicaceae bacterium]|nr:magnesium/cobalt efflux protein [Crocinitomicaceae bacterium]